jgi:uncharacterized membrane protein SpoIIM required for sporulation
METGDPPSTPLLSEETVRQFVRRGLKVATIVFLIEMVLFVAIISVPFFSGEQQAYSDSANQIASKLSGVSPLGQVAEIFGNNMKVALIEFIPGFGAFFFGASIYETARITQAIALTTTFPAQVLVVILFLLPHSWIELPAYAISTTEGLLLLYSAARWFAKREPGRMRMEAGQFLFSVLLVTVTLIVAAVFEVSEVQLGLTGLAMWAPFGLIVAIALLLKRKYSRQPTFDSPLTFQ